MAKHPQTLLTFRDSAIGHSKILKSPKTFIAEAVKFISKSNDSLSVGKVGVIFVPVSGIPHILVFKSKAQRLGLASIAQESMDFRYNIFVGN